MNLSAFVWQHHVCVYFAGRKSCTWQSWLPFCLFVACMQLLHLRTIYRGRSSPRLLLSTTTLTIFCALNRWKLLTKCGKLSKQNTVWDLITRYIIAFYAIWYFAFLVWGLVYSALYVGTFLEQRRLCTFPDNINDQHVYLRMFMLP